MAATAGCATNTLISALAIVMVACLIAVIVEDVQNTESATDDLPLLTPPIESAAPGGAVPNASSPGRRRLFSLHQRRLLSFTPRDIRDRFFREEGGPTNMWDLLAQVDMRIAEMNTRRRQFPCLGSGLMYPYNLTLWNHTNVTMNAECADTYSVPAGASQNWTTMGLFSLSATRFELFMFMGETMLAARVHLLNSSNLTLIEATNGSRVTRVELWYSVGLTNVNGSHAVVQLLALPAERIFEMSVAGMGVGFCGVNLRSANGTFTAHGSADAPGCECADVSTVCCDAENLLTEVACGPLPHFEMPAMGRSGGVVGSMCTFNQSKYPESGPNVLMSNTGPDDAFFGPRTSPIPT